MKSALFLILLVLSTCTSSFPMFAPACPDTEYDNAEAYYRGIYTFCMVINAKALEGGASKFFDCDEMVKGAYRLKWHERDAPGFEWPPEETSKKSDDIVYVK
jgi:hypothetical protein